MSWKLYCDNCGAEIEKRTKEGETVFTKTVTDKSNRLSGHKITLTIHADSEGGRKHIHLCMDCVRTLSRSIDIS